MITVPFKPVATIVFLSAGIVAGLGLHELPAYAHSRAQLFETKADHESGDQSLVDYRYASLLWPSNVRIADKLSRSYLDHSQPSEAINTYMRLKPTEGYPKAASLQIKYRTPAQALVLMDRLLDIKNNPEWLRLKAMALLELGRNAEAEDTARQAASYSLNDPAVAELRGMILASQGKYDELSAYIASMDVPEATGTLQRVGASKLALAQELYATGLPMSSQHVLLDSRQPQNTAYGLLAARLALDSTDRTTWQQTTDLLKETVAANPADVSLRHSYRQLLIKLDDQSGVSEQTKLIDSLSQTR